MLNPNNPESLEKYSSAVSLSDMEIFIFPELMFSLVLANIMSPLLWKWKEDPWFQDIEKMNTNKKLQRIKQYIMNQFEFNLDLDTWGLTTKEKELQRFRNFVDLDTLAQSNALFGYEGDKYYFDMDIRRHFGLDKYTSEAIPYWKTETVEAMTAFWRKEGYSKGAGECVSLSTLYYAALFIIGGVPLEEVYMIATPLHSQNFVNIKEGVITNNRRLVTKNMWFNGTEISMKSRRAIDNEQITFIANNTGYVHRIYKEATMPRETYAAFQEKLRNYLVTRVDYGAITSFLRAYGNRQTCFQFQHERHGKTLYIEAEKVFPYEHGSPYLVGSGTQSKLLEEIDTMEFYSEPIEDRINLRDVEEAFSKSGMTVRDLTEKPERVATVIAGICPRMGDIVQELIAFCKTDPRLPEAEERDFRPTEPIRLTREMGREGIRAHLESLREDSEIADLAFLAYREIKGPGYLQAFLKATVERNPVILTDLLEKDIPGCYEALCTLGQESIYSEDRLAQPDEVWNFRTGDGLEKALALADIAYNRGLPCYVETREKEALAMIGGSQYRFPKTKNVAMGKEDFASL